MKHSLTIDNLNHDDIQMLVHGSAPKAKKARIIPIEISAATNDSEVVIQGMLDEIFFHLYIFRDTELSPAESRDIVTKIQVLNEALSQINALRGGI